MREAIGHRAQRERLARVDPLRDCRRHASAPRRRSTWVVLKPAMPGHQVGVDPQLEAAQEPLLQLLALRLRDEPFGDGRPHAG